MNRLPEKIAEITPDVVRRSLLQQIKQYAPGGVVIYDKAQRLPLLLQIKGVAAIAVQECLEQMLFDALMLMGLLSLNEGKARQTVRALFPLFYERAQQYGWRAMDVALFLKKCQMNAYPFFSEVQVFRSPLFFKAMAAYHSAAAEQKNLQMSKNESRFLRSEAARAQAAQDYHNPSPKVVEMREKIKAHKEALKKKMKRK